MMHAAPGPTVGRRHRRTLAIGLAASLLAVPAVARAANNAPPDSGPSQPVIVVLADQHLRAPASVAQLPIRIRAVAADQAPLLEEVRRAGGR